MNTQAIVNCTNKNTNTWKTDSLLTSEEAARYLNIHPKTIQKLARGGTIPALRIGDLWRFKKSHLDVWIDGQLKSRCH